MNWNETYYRRVIGAIGTSLLIFWGLVNAFGVLIVLVSQVLELVFQNNTVGFGVTYQLIYAVGYLTCFMLPVLFLKTCLKHNGIAYTPMHTSVGVSPWIFLIIPAGIVLIFSASYVNASMVDIFNYAEFSSDVLWGTTDAKPKAYEWVLNFIVICVVPGFCEEFLFRGAILTNCLPFGRSNAIFISAFLFGLMHQNAEQIFYAFVAGIVLGILYEKTKSIWTCTILHIFNNFASVMQSMVDAKFDGWVGGTVYTTLFELFLFLIGVLSLAILIAHFFSQKPSLRNGVFGKELPASDFYASVPVRSSRLVSIFFKTPTMLIFVILCTIQIIALILMAVLYGIFA